MFSYAHIPPAKNKKQTKKQAQTHHIYCIDFNTAIFYWKINYLRKACFKKSTFFSAVAVKESSRTGPRVFAIHNVSITKCPFSSIFPV